MDFLALQKKLIVMLALVGVCAIGCAGALFAGIHYHQPILTGLGIVALLVGFAVQIWFISAVGRRPPV
jgi:protein-S-isoprenylcysteine O-methyltransferase Ste14